MLEARRVHRSVAMHGVAVAVFGLLAWCGVDLLLRGAEALGVPMLVAGAAGATGALLIAWSVARQRAGVQRVARIGMAVAAVVVVAVGVALAPEGLDRGFVITVHAFIGGLLAMFALLAGERSL